MAYFIYNFDMKYIDTHAHIVNSFTDETTEQIISQAIENNVEYIMVPGTTLADSFEALALSKKHKNIFAGFGIHPSDSSEELTQKLFDLDYSGFKFIGETGIDLFHDTNPSLEIQTRSFKAHLDIARKLNLPIEIHTREAYKEVYEIIKDYSDLTLILHSFTGSLDWANKFLDLGAYISFSGIVTFKNAQDLKLVMETIPLERIIIETDSPFLAPVPKRGKKNYPGFVRHVGDFIALNRKEKNVLEIIYKTTKDIFKI